MNPLIIKSVFSFAGKALGFGDPIEKIVDVAVSKIGGDSKKDKVVSEILTNAASAKVNSSWPIVDAVHKMGRQLMAFGVMFIYYESVKQGNPLSVAELASLAALPGAYTIMKGKGK